MNANHQWIEREYQGKTEHKCSVCGFLWKHNMPEPKVDCATILESAVVMSDSGEEIPLEKLVSRAIRSASLCWEHVNFAGSYLESDAELIGLALLGDLQKLKSERDLYKKKYSTTRRKLLRLRANREKRAVSE